MAYFPAVTSSLKVKDIVPLAKEMIADIHHRIPYPLGIMVEYLKAIPELKETTKDKDLLTLAEGITTSLPRYNQLMREKNGRFILSTSCLPSLVLIEKTQYVTNIKMYMENKKEIAEALGKWWYEEHPHPVLKEGDYITLNEMCISLFGGVMILVDQLDTREPSREASRAKNVLIAERIASHSDTTARDMMLLDMAYTISASPTTQ